MHETTDGSRALQWQIDGALRAARAARDLVSWPRRQISERDCEQIEQALDDVVAALELFEEGGSGAAWARAVKIKGNAARLRAASDRSKTREEVVLAALATGPKSTRQLIAVLQEHPGLSRTHERLEAELGAMASAGLIERATRGRRGRPPWIVRSR